MRVLRVTLMATAALSFVAVEAVAQTQNGLPPGVVIKGGVMTMAPIGDDAGDRGPAITAERRPGLIRVLSASDHDLYLKAFGAADHGDWTAARGLADQGHDPVARRIIEWRYLLDKNSGASFGEISAFLKANPDWPARDTLFSRAEAAMDPNMEPHAVLAFFSGREPASAIGKVRLGEAHLATGNSTKGRDLIRAAWISGDFDATQEAAIIQRHGDILTPEVDRARLNRLLFDNDLSAARREMARVPADAQQLANVRLTLHVNPYQGAKMVDALPPSLQGDPGLLVDRTKLLRQQGTVDAIPPLLSKMPTRQMAEINSGKWWSELSQASRTALQTKSYNTAYQIVRDTGLTVDAGVDYAEAEFMAGWLALRFLHEPAAAHTHFMNVAKNFARPISRSRGYYWAGRASEAAGNTETAVQEYREAAKSPETFYGALALAKIDSTPVLHLANASAEPTATEKAAYERSDLTRAERVLGDLGMVSLLRAFAVHDAEQNTDPRHIKLLASDLVDMGFKDVAVRVAKQASYTGTNFFAYLHPVIALPTYRGPSPTPDTAFVLGIIRQETEFDPSSVSGAGARGLMQLMPSSAKRSAGLAGVEYRPNDLLSDVTYNEQLGMVELSDDLSTYGGSYILTAAAYNAGKANVNRWLDTYGDPRSPTVDPIDWIEEIPFKETRNYVQRVLENTEVYRNRLSGRDEPLRILADLYRPRVPDVRALPAGSAHADKNGDRGSVTNK